ncbi:uncharacterized protein LY89DRAFT_695438 [Mollisia scopiformis]|uniref:Uncharacterized protein n=1 Tax=Mollisia scopiformis TaxID=149040 RepID=A0A194XI15_MOLSC|nr:uncharacterized protein LY89DRAFT_695438 [Mollisia scopiformis]KUJ19769.1 hypothetical protein LY89DRAFT_695438 [Mollisia scopiformis]
MSEARSPRIERSSTTQPRLVHFVGSVSLATNTDVFKRLATSFPSQLLRIPDGETGARGNFVYWQKDSFKPFLVKLWPSGPPEAPPEPWSFEPINTRYDEVALESYKELCRLREEGIIRKGVRFQVCLPTPVNILTSIILPNYQVEIEPVLEKALMTAARRIQDNIPKEDLAIQWDMAMDIGQIEFSKFESRPDWKSLKPDFISDAWFSPVKEGITDRAARVMKSIDHDVPMGVHLCYGDSGHKHFIEPNDTALMVELVNKISAGVGRDFDWVHMPVPKDRVDDAYFAPLKDLKIEVAKKFVKDFAVGTECGMGRTKRDELDNVLEVMATVTTP